MTSPSGTRLYKERDRQAFSDLLLLAEKLHEGKEKLLMQMYMYVGAIAFAILSILAVSKTLIDDRNIYPFVRSPAGILILLVATGMYIALNFLMIQYRRRSRRERKAFHEVMGLVQEVFAATKEDMSPIEIAEVRIRLSRLDI